MTEPPETITNGEDDHQERRQLLADYGFPFVFRLDDEWLQPAWTATFEQILIDYWWHECTGDERRARIDVFGDRFPPAWAAAFNQMAIDFTWHELNGAERRARIDLVRPIMEAAPDIQLGEALEHLRREH